MKKTILQIISFLMIFCILFLSFPFSIFASDDDSEDTSLNFFEEMLAEAGYLLVDDIPYVSNFVSEIAKGIVFKVDNPALSAFCNQWDNGMFSGIEEQALNDVKVIINNDSHVLEQFKSYLPQFMREYCGFVNVPTLSPSKLSLRYFEGNTSYFARVTGHMSSIKESSPVFYASYSSEITQINSFYDSLGSSTYVVFNSSDFANLLVRPNFYHNYFLQWVSNSWESVATPQFNDSRPIKTIYSNSIDDSETWMLQTYGLKTDSLYWGMFFSDKFSEIPVFRDNSAFLTFQNGNVINSNLLIELAKNKGSNFDYVKLYNLMREFIDDSGIVDYLEIQNAYTQLILQELEKMGEDVSSILEALQLGLFDTNNAPYLKLILEQLKTINDKTTDIQGIYGGIQTLIRVIEHLETNVVINGDAYVDLGELSYPLSHIDNYTRLLYELLSSLLDSHYFETDLDYQRNLILRCDNILTALSRIYEGQTATNQIVDGRLEVLDRELRDLMFKVDSFYYRNHEDIIGLSSKLDTIITLLSKEPSSGGSSGGVSTYDDTELKLKLDKIIALLELDNRTDVITHLPDLPSDIVFTNNFNTNVNILLNIMKTKYPYAVIDDVVLISRFVGAVPEEPNLTIPINFYDYTTDFTIDLSFYDEYARGYVIGFLVFSTIVFLAVLTVKIFSDLRGK